MLIGEVLKEVRTRKNLSQGDIEQRTGLIRCYISRVENGHTIPSLSKEVFEPSASPLTARGPAMIAPQIHPYERHANEHRAANDEPVRQVGIHNGIENAHQKRPVCGFDACASFKPRLSHGERARRPGNQLDDDGVDQRSDVQCPQKAAASRHGPAQQHPAAPKQVQEQDGFRENRCCKNGKVTSLCWLPAINYPLTPALG